MTDGVKPVKGPRWTQKRLVDMLIECYGPSARGPVDVAAVAAHVDVTPATVRRWLHNPDGPPSRTPARVPPDRIRQLQRAPDAAEEEQERRYLYALRAIDMIAHGETIPPWRNQGYLDEHTVAVIAVHAKPWQQVVFTKANHRAMTAIHRRGKLVSTVVVPNRFHAIAVTNFVMVRQQEWRVYPAENQLDIGRTQVWMADAPAVDLDALAAKVAGVAAAVAG